MIPINGVLIGLGKTALLAHDSATGTVVPSNATHFAFGFTVSNNKTRTHGHISLNDQDCIFQSGVLYCLHTHSYKPPIRKNNSADTFEEVSLYRIATQP